jgi:hypothetical protein
MASKIRMNLDLWDYKDYMQFVQSIRKGDGDVSYSLMQSIIIGWDYEVPLSTPDAIMELGVEESAKVFQTVTQALEAYVGNLEESASEVTVNWKGVNGHNGWNTRRFFLYSQMQEDGKFDKVENMMREIATMPDLDETEPLTATQGIKMNHAIRRTYERLISGKN